MSSISDFIRKKHHNFCSMVVVAAGASTRMGADKLTLMLDGMPVLARTLRALDPCDAIDEIIVVTRLELLETVAAMKEQYAIRKLAKVVIGGATRTESALSGATEADPRAKIIAIHDGARPFVDAAMIAEVVHQAALHQAAAPALPVKDTIKIARSGVVSETPDRASLFAVQTPQAFHADLIKAALSAAVSQSASFTDDCAAMEALGVHAFLCPGSEENIKITTPADLALAETILKRRSGESAP